MWGMLLVIAPFMVHYELIVTLYVGTTYLAAGTVMFLLLACYPITYGNLIHGLLANAKLRMRGLAIRELVSTVAYLFLSLLFVGYYHLGAIGVAMATFVVYGLGSILLLWPFGKGMVGASWAEIWSDILIPGILPFFSALMVMKLVDIAYPVESWANIGLSALLGVVVYFTAIWFVAKEVDKSQIKHALLGLLSRMYSG